MSLSNACTDTVKGTPHLRLHNFFNSSAAYRVRIALNLKGLAWEHVGVNLRSGEQSREAYKAINPAGMVPCLEVNGEAVSQSLVIIDRLDRLQPEPALIPLQSPLREQVMAFALQIGCEIHPLNNLRVLKHLVNSLGQSEAQRDAWVHHWISIGFNVLESQLPDHDGWCFDGRPTLADCYLIPQVANARRAHMDLSPWPRIQRIDAFARQHPAFAAAAPQQQPDYIAP